MAAQSKDGGGAFSLRFGTGELRRVTVYQVRVLIIMPAALRGFFRVSTP